MFSESELIEGCRANRQRHQEALYKQFFGFAMSVCLRYAAGRDEAIEILNDSFMKVFAHIHSYNPEKPFKTWFRRILVNTALDHYRSGRRHHEMMATDEHEPELIAHPEVEVSLSADEILELMAQLPEIQKLVFNLYEVEGFSHEEIAGMLDVSPGTSRSNLSRARKKLENLYLKRQHLLRNETVLPKIIRRGS